MRMDENRSSDIYATSMRTILFNNITLKFKCYFFGSVSTALTLKIYLISLTLHIYTCLCKFNVKNLNITEM